MPKECIVYGEYSLASGYVMTAQTLPTRPTTIVAGNNFIAIGVGRYLRERAFHVPNDISVVSFDDVPISWDCGYTDADLGDADRRFIPALIRAP